MRHYTHSRNKTVRGEAITDVCSVVDLLLSGGWIYHHHKPIHPGRARSWSIGYLAVMASKGYIFRCLDAVTGAGYRSAAKKEEEEE